MIAAFISYTQIFLVFACGLYAGMIFAEPRLWIQLLIGSISMGIGSWFFFRIKIKLNKQ